MRARSLLPMLAAWALAACGDSAGEGAGGAGGGPAEPVVEELTPDAPPLPGESSCRVTITRQLPIEGATHREVCEPVTYGTNPPSSGDHWRFWPAFGTYEDPIPREMYVHGLEHGAVVLAYDCPDGCPEVLEAFGAAEVAVGVDPLCAGVDGAGPNRLIVTPDPLLDAPIGIAAWGATYVATCVDVESLVAFVREQYGAGPEKTCAPGKDPADPTTGVPFCDGAGGAGAGGASAGGGGAGGG